MHNTIDNMVNITNINIKTNKGKTMREYILISSSSVERASKRIDKSRMNSKRIKAKTEKDAILKRDKYLKDMDADLLNFRGVLDTINGRQV